MVTALALKAADTFAPHAIAPGGGCGPEPGTGAFVFGAVAAAAGAVLAGADEGVGGGFDVIG